VTNNLVTALQLARSEAVKQGMRVTVCKTGNAMAIPPVCDAAASWQQGWLVFVDGGTRGVIDLGDTLLWTQKSVPSAVSITPSNNYSGFISYLPSGTSQGSSGPRNGKIYVCVAGNQREIIINKIGRPRLYTSTC
jgi:type IV fimbrial biogenesis protein FimT